MKDSILTVLFIGFCVWLGFVMYNNSEQIITKEFTVIEKNNKLLENARKLIKHTNISKLELRIQKILNDLNISYTANKFIHSNNFDLIFDNKIILEINGDYWHANPEKYKASDIISYPNKNYISAEKIWNRDKIKKQKIESKGYNVYYLWETEIKQMTDKNIIEFIFNILK